MGARQSKRSVDITTTPKKEGVSVEDSVIADAAAPGDGKLERIEESDAQKPTTNGIAPHTDVNEDKDKDKDEASEKEKEKKQSEEVKAASEETKQQESTAESPVEATKVTTPTESNPDTSNDTVASPDTKETKKKDKMKKRWSFRSISFTKKDKSFTKKDKPSSEQTEAATPKNGDITKEEPLAEGAEEAENAANSPVEEKSAVNSPTESETPTPAVPVATTEAKEEVATPPASSPVAEEKKEEPTAPSAPSPVPVEDKKEELEKVDAEKKVVESTPEPEAPVENSVTQEVHTTETVEEAPKTAPPTVPVEVPVSPPSVPAITEDVASVTKAIQEIEISDKAVAAAVNETIECNTKEIITDGYQYE